MFPKSTTWVFIAPLFMAVLWRPWSARLSTLLLAFAALCGGYLGHPGELPRWVFWEGCVQYSFMRGEV